jgi:transposase
MPRQHSSGDKQRSLGSSKRGDPYLRMLLIHAFDVFRCGLKTDSRSRWIAERTAGLGVTSPTRGYDESLLIEVYC